MKVNSFENKFKRFKKFKTFKRLFRPGYFLLRRKSLPEEPLKLLEPLKPLTRFPIAETYRHTREYLFHNDLHKEVLY
jgi:hypothetical protein